MIMLPHNIDAEIALIGALILDNDKITEISQQLSSDDFYKSTHQHIFQAIVDVSRNGDSADFVTVSALVKKHGILASDITALCSDMLCSDSAEGYAKIIKDLSVRRSLIVSANRIMDLAGSQEVIDDVVENAQKMINSVSVFTTQAKSTAFREIGSTSLDRYEANMRDRGRGNPKIINTGFKYLDWMLCGLHPGDLYVLAARPSMGKSALAGNIALNTAKSGKPCMVFSLEMTKEQWFDRAASNRSGVNAMKFRRGNFETEDWKQIVDCIEDIITLPIYIDDSGRLPIGELCRRAHREASIHNARLIVIDHLQILVGRDQRSRDREIGEITSRLKALAKDIQCPVLLLSQLNRNVDMRDNKRPVLSDLRDSGNIEQDADVVMFLYREAYYLEKAKTHIDLNGCETAQYHRVKNLAELDIAKQRNGPTGTIPLFWNSKTTTFTEMERENV